MLAALSFALLLASSPARAPNADGEVRVTSLDEPQTIAGAWRFHEGDGDPTLFASPDFDDRSWQPLVVPGGIGAQVREDVVGIYWLRVRIHVPAVQRELSLRLGPVDSAAEFYVDGVKVGALGEVVAHDGRDGDALVDVHDVPTIWPVPLDAAKDADVVLAIRGRRAPWRVDVAPRRGGIASGPVLIGTTSAIVRDAWLRDLDKILAGVVVLAIALYHLQLFRKRREQRDYLWFGVFSLAMSTYLFASSDAALWLLGTEVHARIFWLSLILTLPTFVQFLWPLLGLPLGKWVRAIQIAMTAYAFGAALSQWFVLKLIAWFELLLMLPLMIVTVVVVVRAAWRKNAEARTLLAGTLALVVAAADNILMERTTWQLPQLMPAAMAVFVFSIAISLANRFSRVFRELDEKQRLADEVRVLNAQVQARVKERSEELSRALSRVALAHGARDGAPLDVAKGTTLDDRYAVDRALGAGGMGAVYAGRDLATGAAVAIKVIKAQSTAELDALQRFLREARAAVSVDHPAIVKMLHVDISSDGLFYQAQELVDGVTLDAHLKRGPLKAPLVARAGSVLAGALAAAHAKGVIHRDVKPSNIMLTSAPPGLKLLDFGVAKITTNPSDATGSGRHIGTPAYMAPELRYIGDGDVTDKVDVYALGVVLHLALTSALPGRALDVDDSASPALFALVRDCLHDDPNARPSAAEVAVKLHAIADALGAAHDLAWDTGAPAAASGITDLLRDLVRS